MTTTATAYETQTIEKADAEKPRRHTITTDTGYEITAECLTVDDMRERMREFETKYGMTSKEFAKRWGGGELDCAVMDYFEWEDYCDTLATVYGEEDLKIANQGEGELILE